VERDAWAVASRGVAAGITVSEMLSNVTVTVVAADAADLAKVIWPGRLH
jgi:hypothetical protein